MNTNTHVINNKIVLGELTSKTFLTDHIAYGFLALIKEMKVKASVRKAKEGWIATLEDPNGNMVLFSKDFYPQEELARAKAEESLKLLA